MSKPTYLPLLNTIAVNERKGEQFLNAWANTTDDKALAEVLRFVAIREGEHAWSIAKRIAELGYRISPDQAFDVFEDFDALLDCVCSEASDRDKVAFVGGALVGDGSDPFASFFQDTSIDPQTGALLGRYIAEERDSGRRLEAAYRRITGDAPATDSTELDKLKASIKALRKEVKTLKKLHRAD